MKEERNMRIYDKFKLSVHTPLALCLVTLGAMARLAPHPANFTPVGSVSLFAGARLRGWRAFLVPLAIMAVTDVLLSAAYGFAAYSRLTLFVYASFLVNVWIGRGLSVSESPLRIGAATAVCATQFFLITNFGVWMGSGYYPQTVSGLGACYLAAIPFFGRTLAGDLVFSAVLFGLHSWLTRLVATGERVKAL